MTQELFNKLNEVVNKADILAEMETGQKNVVSNQINEMYKQGCSVDDMIGFLSEKVIVGEDGRVYETTFGTHPKYLGRANINGVFTDGRLAKNTLDLFPSPAETLRAHPQFEKFRPTLNRLGNDYLERAVVRSELADQLWRRRKFFSPVGRKQILNHEYKDPGDAKILHYSKDFNNDRLLIPVQKKGWETFYSNPLDTTPKSPDLTAKYIDTPTRREYFDPKEVQLDSNQKYTELKPMDSLIMSKIPDSRLQYIPSQDAIIKPGTEELKYTYGD